MSYTLPDEINPYRAPVAGIGAGPDPGMDTDAELTRRFHLNHEASVKSIGSLYYLSAILCGLTVVGSVFLFVSSFGNRANNPAGPIGAAFIFVMYMLMLALSGALGYGLSKLHVWARWTAVVLNGLGMLYFLGVGAFMLATMPTQVAVPALGLLSIVFLIMSYILYLLLSRKSGVVFSPAYKEVIAKTPHIKYKTSLIVKIFLGLFFVLIVLGIIGAIVNSMK